MRRTELEELRGRVERLEGVMRHISDIHAVEALTELVGRLQEQIATLEAAADREERRA